MNTDRSSAELGFLGFWAWDNVTGQVDASPELNRFFQVDEGGKRQLTFCDYEQRIHPDDLEWVKTARIAGIGPSGHGVIEYRVIDEHGRVRWVMCRAIYELDGNREISRAHGMMFDVTALKADGSTVQTPVVPFVDPLNVLIDSCIEAYRAAEQMGNDAMLARLADVLKMAAATLSKNLMAKPVPQGVTRGVH